MSRTLQFSSAAVGVEVYEAVTAGPTWGSTRRWVAWGPGQVVAVVFRPVPALPLNTRRERAIGHFPFRDALRDVDLEVLVVVAGCDPLFRGFRFLVPADEAFQQGVQVDSEQGDRDVDAELEREPEGGFEVVDRSRQRHQRGARQRDRDFLYACL